MRNSLEHPEWSYARMIGARDAMDHTLGRIHYEHTLDGSFTYGIAGQINRAIPFIYARCATTN